jgi:hypothetical protein
MYCTKESFSPLPSIEKPVETLKDKVALLIFMSILFSIPVFWIVDIIASIWWLSS